MFLAFFLVRKQFIRGVCNNDDGDDNDNENDDDSLAYERERTNQTTPHISCSLLQAKHIFFSPTSRNVQTRACVTFGKRETERVSFFSVRFVCCAAARLLSWFSVKKTEKNAMWFFPCTWTADEDEWNGRIFVYFFFFLFQCGNDSIWNTIVCLTSTTVYHLCSCHSSSILEFILHVDFFFCSANFHTHVCFLTVHLLLVIFVQRWCCWWACRTASLNTWLLCCLLQLLLLLCVVDAYFLFLYSLTTSFLITGQHMCDSSSFFLFHWDNMWASLA